MKHLPEEMLPPALVVIFVIITMVAFSIFIDFCTKTKIEIYQECIDSKKDEYFCLYLSKEMSGEFDKKVKK